MKFSACCITPSKRGSLWYAIVGLVFVGLLPCAARAQDTSLQPSPQKTGVGTDFSSEQPAEIADANTLQKDGKKPFHLKMSFQVYDLTGKPAEQGLLEYWWAGPEGTHLDLNAASFGTVHSTDGRDLPNNAARRSVYLAGELLQAMLSPASMLGLPKAPVEAEDRVVGSAVLKCMHPVPPVTIKPAFPVRFEVCSDTATGTIRLIEAPDHSVARNRVGTFAGTRVALDLAIAWGRARAITGHVESLQGFRPDEDPVALEKPPVPNEVKQSPPGSARLAGGVVAGNKIGGAQPVYPASARRERIQGTVLLMATISKEGKITDLFPLASPDSSLAASALAAVKTWTYKPYLLNGSPTDVSTTITVNFNIN